MEEWGKLTIVRLGHPTLRAKSQPVSKSAFGTPAFLRFCKSLAATMFDAQGVGLAAPQVAQLQRCFVYYAPSTRDERATMEPRILVNPEIEAVEHTLESGWEGCLSIPELRGLVPRLAKIAVRAWDPEGRRLEFVATGFQARVIQHEYDHLDGVVFLDRMDDLSSLCYEPEWIRYVLHDGEDDEGADEGE